MNKVESNPRHENTGPTLKRSKREDLSEYFKKALKKNEEASKERLITKKTVEEPSSLSKITLLFKGGE